MLSKNFQAALTVSAAILFLSSCKTYEIPMESFRKQFETVESDSMQPVTVHTPYGKWTYQANPITTIVCVDKKTGELATLRNGPSVKMKMTYGYEKKSSVFYFDRSYVEDGIFYGTESTDMKWVQRSIPLDSITRIEITDGQKNFRYVK